MNKRELSKIRRPDVTEEISCLAERMDGGRYIVTAEVVDVGGEKILLLNFFRRPQATGKKTEAAFRTFISKDDYITQDLASASVRWKTGSFQSMLGWYCWNIAEKGHGIEFASASDCAIAQHYMEPYLDGEEANVWDAIGKFQEGVMEGRLVARHKKETDKIDSKMEMVPEIPEGFEEWVHEEAMRDKRYLVYEAAGKRKETKGYCIYCKKTVVIDAKAVRPRNKKRGECPNCGSPVTFIPKGYFPICQSDSKWVCLIQKIPTGIIARYFHVYQVIRKDGGYKEEFGMVESCRVFFEGVGQEGLKKDPYEWGVYKQHGLPRWCPDQSRYNCARAVVYTGNLPEVLEGTVYQYCALDLYQKKSGCSPIPVWRFMDRYPSHRYLEMFLKYGLVRLAGEVVEGRAYELNEDRKTPVEMLGIPKNYIPILREVDGGTNELLLLRQCASDQVLPAAKDIHEFYQKFGGDDELLGVVNRHMGIRKFISYMDKQEKSLPKQKETPCHAAWASSWNHSKEKPARASYRNLSKDWLDYISWCAQLNYDMDDMYVLLPPDFRKAHDRVMGEYQAHEDEQERKRQEELERLMEEALSAARDLPAMMMRANGLMVVLPKNGDEIKEEGRALHHCVGSYVGKVAKGETMILFVRKESEPDTPYFTLEWRNNDIAQCRGAHNCDMPPEVKAFTQAFKKKMLDGTGKEEKTIRRCG